MVGVLVFLGIPFSGTTVLERKAIDINASVLIADQGRGDGLTITTADLFAILGSALILVIIYSISERSARCALIGCTAENGGVINGLPGGISGAIVIEYTRIAITHTLVPIRIANGHRYWILSGSGTGSDAVVPIQITLGKAGFLLLGRGLTVAFHCRSSVKDWGTYGENGCFASEANHPSRESKTTLKGWA